MLSLYDINTMNAALSLPLDPILHRLLSDRVRDTIACGLEKLTHILVVESGDEEGDFIREAAFSPFRNPLSETRYGDPDHIPPWDWADCLDGWGWEFIRTIGNDGFAFIVLVPDRDEIEPTLRAMCASYITPTM
ncbi:hypothetical protein A0J57_23145 [Sphingobium sp. 22B]|uniref:hypothetical protein n=1 Tax=unclassified Sphingobium TaxID=2611147 RepID=UPI000785BD80|nr:MULTISPECIES: hypothetical protein [unclassified Sphingobium]KXU29485.1 hypothetical protein AXW74_22815 [Sphingobium sp. AM]KYC29963.1 hypothetical protein A0J57_23145 [Sphingobium sp. 22B]OAP30023.1 hypothetical protein A8O16_20705 [Sphingobium sp. 20006FA]